MREHVDCDHIENVSSTVAKVQKFLQDGCGCHRGLKGDQFSDYLKAETVISNLYDCLELSHAELDLVILANLQAFTAAEVTGGEKKEDSSLQLSLSVSTHLQRNVSARVRHQ